MASRDRRTPAAAKRWVGEDVAHRNSAGPGRAWTGGSPAYRSTA